MLEASNPVRGGADGLQFIGFEQVQGVRCAKSFALQGLLQYVINAGHGFFQWNV